MRGMPGIFFALTGDVKHAHRLVKVAEEDWGLQACRTNANGPGHLWLNLVGTFGVSSAAYHWARLMAGLGRLGYYALGKAGVQQLVYVDDLLFLTNDCKGIGQTVLLIFLYVVLGLPFTWKKFRGGVELTWVGFEIVLKGAKLGLSSSRAQWLVKWLRTTADLGQAKIADVSSVLGRLSFGLTALGHYRPFLGPVYAWVAAMQNFSVCRLPKAIQLIFRFLAKVLDGDGRLLAVGSAKQQEVELFKTDAKADGNTVRIAGWACCDSADTWQCRWFSETLDHTNAPWLF